MNTKTTQAIKVKGIVTCRQYDVDGKLLKEATGENVITNAGLAALAGLAGNVGAITPFTYLAVGTSNTAAVASQTTLVAEISDSGLSRTSATVTRSTTTQTNDTLQFDYTWTVSGTKTVEEAGVLNSSSGGILLARKLTTSFALSSGQQFALTYKIIFA